MPYPEAFLERDFLAYEKHLQKNPEYNALRLAVRRKLKGLVDHVAKAAKGQDVALSSQAGLHHPYVFNGYRVREQRAYLCRSPKERKKLAAFFGEALGKDAETHYIQTVLEVSLDDQVVESALRIHPQAWWDGQNLKKKVSEDPEFCEQWAERLRALPPGFVLRLHDWRKNWWAVSIKPHDLREYFEAYTPGEHWLHLVRELPKEDAVDMGDDGPEWLAQSMLALLPVYESILWEP